MGRDKKAQRTKGNKQPSSSGRSADLLGGVTGGVGFSALQDLGYVPAAHQCLGADEGAVAASFRVALRKMMKKDATTKVKALQEFETLCHNESQEDILSALPFWPRLYNKLSIDVERRVREATQTSHRILSNRVGRQMAPHLKSLMPSWVLGICDPHPSAAAAAARSFQEAFSKEKRAEVILFTSREIISHFADMLFVQTPQTLSDPKTTAPEDMENKHVRVLSCSLQCLSWLIQLTTTTITTTDSDDNDEDDDGDGDEKNNNDNDGGSDSDERNGSTAAKDGGGGGGLKCGAAVKSHKLLELLPEIIENPGFWKLSKHKNSGVRRSWFDFVTVVLVSQPQVLRGLYSDLTTCVLTSLDDTEGQVLPSVWTAFLRLDEVNKDWRQVKAARGSTNRVLSVLREGGRGAGGGVYPLVLPLFCLLTPSTRTGAEKEGGRGKEEQEEDNKFYINFCRALSTGILKFPSCGAGVKALYQCLQHLATITNTTDDVCTSLWATLMEYQVVGLLEAAFVAVPPVSSATLYPEVAKLLRLLATLEERAKVKVEEKEHRMKENIILSSSSSFLSIFWEKFIHMCEIKILSDEKEEGEKERMEVISRLVSFLRILKHPNSCNHGKKCLRFAGAEEEEKPEEEVMTEEKEVMTEEKEEEVFRSATEDAMSLLVTKCHEIYKCREDRGIYNLLTSIVQSFPCPSVYQSFLGKTQGTQQSEVTARDVLERKVLPTLEEIGLTSSTTVCGSAASSSLLLSTVEMFASLYGHLEDEERREVLQGLKPNLEIKTLHHLVKTMTSRRHVDKAASDWLLSTKLGNRVLQLAEELCQMTNGKVQPLTSEYTEDVKALLMFVLDSGGKRGPVLGLETVSEMLKSLGRGLTSSCNSGSDWNTGRGEMAKLAASLAEIMPSHPSWQSPGAREFLEALFSTLCECPDSVTLQLLRTTFLQAIRASVTASQGQESASRSPESAGRSPESADRSPESVIRASQSSRHSHLIQALRDIREKVTGNACTYQLAALLASITLDLLTLGQDSAAATADDDSGSITVTPAGSTDIDAGSPDDNTSVLITDNTNTDASETITMFSNASMGSTDSSADTAVPHTSKTSTVLPDRNTRGSNTDIVDTDAILLLDNTHIQTLLEQIIVVEGQWAALENAMSALYVAPYILKGSVAFREFPFPKQMADGTSWDHRHHRTSLFICNVLIGLCEAGEEGDISLGKYTHLFVDVLHSACSAAIMMGHTLALGPSSEVSEDEQSGVSRLLSDSRKLLTRLNLGNKRLIAKQIRDRCSGGSTAWCVTLTKVFSQWLDQSEVNATRLLQGLDPDCLGYTSTKQALLSLLPQSSLLEIMEEEVACLSSLSEEPFSAPSCLSLLSSVLAILPADSPGIGDTISSIFSVFFQWRERADGVFLFAADLQGVAWEDLAVTCAVVRLVTVVVTSHGARLTASDWDFVLCCLSSWVQSLQESLQSIQEETVAGTFTYSVCCCVKAVADLMTVLEEAAGQPSSSSSSSSPYPTKLLEDWVDFFAPPVFDSLINIFVGLAGAYKNQPSTLLHGVCSGVCSAVISAAPQHLARHSLPASPALVRQDQEQEDGEEEEQVCLAANEETLLRHLILLLTSPHPAIQGAAYCLLNTAMPALIGSWDEKQLPITEDEELPARSLPHSLVWILREVKQGEAGRLGGGTELAPHSPLFPKMLGYLLGWKLTFTALALTSDPKQHQYCTFLRDKGHLPSLLYNLFTLMPLKPVAVAVDGGGGDEKGTPTFFTTPLKIKPAGMSSARLVPHLACQVYYSAVSSVPAVVHQWFLALDRHSMTVVDSFTTTFVSPILVQQEMTSITNSSDKFDNMVVRCRPGAREVVAIYTVDEARMELVLRLAANHPLGTVTVEDHKRIGVSLAQWRNWLLGLTTMLTHRNTPLLRSLAFWKQNVDQRFKGLEECYICYYVIHGTTHQLPKLLCRTCKKKFHSACLYKWFNSSNNSTCPLCRSLF